MTGTWMRAREVRALLGISVWDLRQLVALGQLKTCWPLGIKAESGKQPLDKARDKKAEKKRRKKRGRPKGERVPYYRRSAVEKLQRARLE